MNKSTTSVWALALVALAIALNAGSARADDEQIRTVIEKYDAATSMREGKLAASLLAPEAAGFFERVRTLALSAERPTLQREPRIVRMQVVLMRAVHGRGLLEKWTGRDMFAATVDAGQVAGFLQGVALGSPSTSGTRAEVPLLVEGQDSGFTFLVDRVGGEWFVNPIPLMEKGLEMSEAFPKDDNVFDELLLRIASRASGRPVDKTIWSPR